MEHFRGCLIGYSGHVGSLPSKADRIMSRYRPIAPRPTLPYIPEPDKSASSAITSDNLYVRPQDSEAPTSIAPPFTKQKSKRVRKRPVKEADSKEPSKRLAMANLLNLAERGQSCHGFAADVVQLSISEDVGFMERAAASAPSSVFPLEKGKKIVADYSYGYGGCFTEMIRGIAGLPSAAHVQTLLQQQQQQQLQQPAAMYLNVPKKEPAKLLVDEAPGQGSAKEERDVVKEEFSSDAFWSCFSGESMRERVPERATSDEQQQSGLDEEKSDGEDDGRRRVVTLNLLPESPTISTCSSTPKGMLNMRCNSLLNVEQVYGQSSEPVVLVDDLSCTVLWVNQGYLKVCKDTTNMPASFIDPLGVPTQLGQLQVQVDGQSECISATLYGFLKKLVVDMGDRGVPHHACTAFSSAVKEVCTQTLPSIIGLNGSKSLPQNSKDMQVTSMTSTNNLPVGSRVITPQPVRLVGSVVSLESITEFQNRGISDCSLELVKKQMDEESLPGFITDEAKVVRWVNTAYKTMIGQPECPWLVSTMKRTRSVEPPTITGEVLLSCNVDIPASVMSFSGRANVQWTRSTGERSCMTVPCDVYSFVDSNASRRRLVWRFDIQASLSLTCGSVGS